MSSLTIIEQQLKSVDIQKQLIIALDLSPDDEAAQREAFKYASSVLQEIKKSEGNEYGDLTKCTPQSICMAVIDAAQFKIQIDGRKLAHLEARWDKNQKATIASLMIDTNGFVAKIKEFYPDADFQITPVFKGDDILITGYHGEKELKYTCHNPFGGANDLTGIIVGIRYSLGDKIVKDVHPVSIGDLEVMKSKGKGTAWHNFPLERMKTAALKRACKWHFRQNAIIQKVIDYDNKDYDLQAATPVRKSIVDNINASLTPPVPDAQEDHASGFDTDSNQSVGGEPEYIDADFTDPAPMVDKPELMLRAFEEANRGTASFIAWGRDLSDEEKLIIRAHKELMAIAKTADAQKNNEAPI